MPTTVDSEFRANKGPQSAFFQSDSRVVAYGGAMGGGKSRALCERMFDWMLEYPGMVGVIARQKHTSIVETTRKTMMEQVLDPRLIQAKKASMGEDYVRLVNGSTVHFIGLDDPVRWYSSEISVFMVDQVEECEEDPIVKLITRIRHPIGPKSLYTGRLALPQMDGTILVENVVDFPLPGKVVLSFNPENPDHWLRNWFILGGERTKHGFYKPELCVQDADFPIGDAEFFFARVVDNPHVGVGYMASLAALPERLRRRYLDGNWEYIAGNCFFDEDALTEYVDNARVPVLTGHTVDENGKSRLIRRRGGPWSVWETPVRGRFHVETGRQVPAHRYVMGVDVSSGGSQDYSACQIVEIEGFKVVAEFQAKMDPDLVAIEAARMGRVYNDALIVPEVTGGYGVTIVRELERIGYRRIFTRRVLDRITKKWTDKYGFDTNTATRMVTLDALERVVRERSLGLPSDRTLAEMGAFVWDDGARHPEARSGQHDDLVMALAIAVSVAETMPREFRRPPRNQHRPVVSSVTGY